MNADLLRELAHLFAIEANSARADEAHRLTAIADDLFTRARTKRKKAAEPFRAGGINSE